MDQHHATVWTGVVAALLTATALLFTVGDSRLYDRLGVASGVAALYVLLSFFVPLPLVRTWTQRAASRALKRPEVFRARLASFQEEGEALLRQRQAGLFDEATQKEEEAEWAWAVVRFLEDSLGKLAAAEFEENVLTYESPPYGFLGIEGTFISDMDEGLVRLSSLSDTAKGITLRSGFDAQKWNVE